jgi:rhomboid protease GluP
VNDSSHHDVPVTPADYATAAPLPVEGQPVQQAERRRSTSLWNYPATYSLIGINVAVFIAMVFYGHLWQHLSGSNPLFAEFNTQTLVNFGGSDALLILQGQWWRLVTAAFVHAYLLHIALNMWCLWNLGIFGEPLLGRRGLICVYLLTGITGNMFSLAWAVLSNTDAIVVGASGAVFGIAGILIVLLSNRQLSLPWEELKALRRQVIFFAVINLAIGIGPQLLHIFSATLGHIDNTAHIGGFVSGLALGLPLFPKMMSGRAGYRRRQMQTFIVATLVLCLFGYAISAFAR